MLNTALHVELAVLRESLRYPKGLHRSWADCSSGPARLLEVGAVAPVCRSSVLCQRFERMLAAASACRLCGSYLGASVAFCRVARCQLSRRPRKYAMD